MTKLLNNKNFKIILLTFICIQPILDLYWLYNTNLLVFSFPTILRILFITILGIMSFWIIKFNKKHSWLLIYCILVLFYVIFHHFNTINFTSYVPSNFNYSIIDEIFYIIRMTLPVAMIYFAYNSNVSKKDFGKIVTILAILMSGSIVLTNLFKISFGSYSDNIIKGNIIDWFIDPSLGYILSASRGLFFSSWVSATMILFAPYLFYLYIKTEKAKYLLLVILQFFAMFMIGTKATTYSFIIITVVMLIGYLGSVLITKEQKFSTRVSGLFLLLILLAFVILPFSPSTNRTGVDVSFQSERKDQDKAETTDEDLIEAMRKEGIIINTNNIDEALSTLTDTEAKKFLNIYFDNNYQDLAVNPVFMKVSYSYTNDPLFWYDVIKNESFYNKINNRYIQTLMFERIKEVNNNKLDNWLGISYSRASSVYTLERDFLYQYYSLGIIGVILFLFPYIIVLFLAMLKMLVYFKKNSVLENYSLVLGIGLTLCIAYYSGNVLDTLGVTIVLGFFCGYLLKRIVNKPSNEEV